MYLYSSLGPLVNKVKEYQVETIVDTLCSNMLSDKQQLRDISSIGKYPSYCICHFNVHILYFVDISSQI